MVMLMPHDEHSIKPGLVSGGVGGLRQGSPVRESLVALCLKRTPPAARAFLAKVMEVALPPQCPGCRVIVEGSDTLCGTCWSQLRMFGPAVCEMCGFPFPVEQHAPLCGACVRRKPPFNRARSAVAYDDASRHLILAFKHADRLEAAVLFSHWMASAAPELLDDADVLVPVPLDRRRLFERRYNQAGLLASHLARLTGVPARIDGVERIKPSPARGQRISRTERRRNVAGAFRVRSRDAGVFRGKRVLVVDDVYTTGATAWAMARCLKRAGAVAVDVLTVARVANKPAGETFVRTGSNSKDS